ncbi:MAG: hypothetical protein U5K84_04880 [Alkalibacterium sp.]|nr:hypothetical protein [Alkalibacterium sp.]
MMKKSIKLLALAMTGGMLLIGCGDVEEIDNDLPDVEETEDDLMNDDLLDEEMDEDVE